MNLKSMQQLLAREENVEMEGNYIEQSGTQFCVRSHNTQDTNFGCYPSKEEAEARLNTILGYGTSEGVRKEWDERGRGRAERKGSIVKRAKYSRAVIKLSDEFGITPHRAVKLYQQGKRQGWSLAKIRKEYAKGLEATSQYGVSGWQYGRRMPVGYIAKRTISGFPKDRGVGTRMPNPSRGMGRGIGRGARLEGYGTSEGVKKEWEERDRHEIRPEIEELNKRVEESTRRRHEAEKNKIPGLGPRKRGKPKPGDMNYRNPKIGLESFADYGEPMAGTMSHSHIDPAVWFHPPSLTQRYKNEDLRIPTDNPREKNDKFLDVTKRNSKETNEQRMKLLKRSGPGGAPPQIPVRTTAMASHSGVYQPSGLFAKSWPARTKQGRQFTAYDRRGVL